MAFQDSIPDNNCFGCGPDNEKGLRIKSTWSGEDVAICRFQPSVHHNAGPRQYLNGGIIATLVDCHCVCTAIAKAYQLAGRKLGTGEPIWYATGHLSMRYLKPVPLKGPVDLEARVVEVGPRKIRLSCLVLADGDPCAEGEVVAVKVPSDWMGQGNPGRPRTR